MSAWKRRTRRRGKKRNRRKRKRRYRRSRRKTEQEPNEHMEKTNKTEKEDNRWRKTRNKRGRTRRCRRSRRRRQMKTLHHKPISFITVAYLPFAVSPSPRLHPSLPLANTLDCGDTHCCSPRCKGEGEARKAKTSVRAVTENLL